MNSIVLDGSVSKDGRMNHWTSAHKRIIFATPQAFKNDVFKGKPLTPASPQKHLGLRVHPAIHSMQKAQWTPGHPACIQWYTLCRHLPV